MEINEDMINNLKSQISPEMIENFSKMMKEKSNVVETEQNNTTSQNTETHTGPDLNNIDMNMVLKMSKMLGNLNDKENPNSNLLNSLKPYLRESRKGKLDSYSALLNMSKMAGMTEIFKKKNSKDDIDG